MSSQKEQRSLLNWRSCIVWLVVLLILTATRIALARHTALRQAQAQVFECEDAARGIAFEVRGNWDVEYFERNNTYHLNRRGFIEKSEPSMFIRLYPSYTEAFEPDKTPQDLDAFMELEMERMHRVLEFATVVEPTRIVERGDYRIATTTFLTGRAKSSETWKNGKREQLTDVYVISTIREDEPDRTIPDGDDRLDHNRRLAIINVSRGNRAKANAEAEEIVNSLRFIAFEGEPYEGSNLVCR
jgi:hypothetical protein